MICAQTRVPGVSVSKVARRYDINANQVFNWLKEPRFVDAEPEDAEPAFLPVEITEALEISFAGDTADPGTLEIDLASGHRLRIGQRSEALDQLGLTLEEEEIARAVQTPDAEAPSDVPKGKPKRKPLPDHLPRNDEVLIRVAIR